VARAVSEDQFLWRYITGSFLARISAQQESRILPADENLLAILKWRPGLIDPSNRWCPILLRYIGYLSGRITGLGGNASQIPASPDGYQTPAISPVEHGRDISVERNSPSCFWRELGSSLGILAIIPRDSPSTS
jgi:hypothetical protein